MKVIIAGGRYFDDYERLKERCDYYLSDQKDIEIVSGRAKGADRLGEQYAKERGYNLKIFPANWNEYGKKAGFIRNSEMGEYSDALIAFWDKKSRGTKNMIEIAEKLGLKIRIVYF